MSTDFERDVIDRLARIEVKVEVATSTLSTHDTEDTRRFDEMALQIRSLEISRAEAVAAGRRGGVKAATWVGGAIVAIAEIARAMLK